MVTFVFCLFALIRTSAVRLNRSESVRITVNISYDASCGLNWWSSLCSFFLYLICWEILSWKDGLVSKNIFSLAQNKYRYWISNLKHQEVRSTGYPMTFLLSFFKKYIKYSIFICMCWVNLCVPYVFLVPTEVIKGCWIPCNWSIHGCTPPPCRCWEWNPSSMEEQPCC